MKTILAVSLLAAIGLAVFFLTHHRPSVSGIAASVYGADPASEQPVNPSPSPLPSGYVNALAYRSLANGQCVGISDDLKPRIGTMHSRFLGVGASCSVPVLPEGSPEGFSGAFDRAERIWFGGLIGDVCLSIFRGPDGRAVGTSLYKIGGGKAACQGG